MPFTIRYADTGIAIATHTTMAHAAAIAMLSPDEIAWAIGEEGRCDVLLPTGPDGAYREAVIRAE